MFDRAKPNEVEAGASSEQDHAAGGAPLGRLRPSLSSLLVEEGVATSDQLEQAMVEGQQTGERLGEVVLRHGWINEAGLAALVARQWDLSFVALSMITVDDSARTLLSREVSERLGASPVGFDDGVPVVAIADPSEERFTGVKEALGTNCSFFVTTPSALAGLIDKQDSVPAEAVASPEPAADSVAEVVVESEPEPADPAPALTAVEPEHADDTPVFEQLDRLVEQLRDERERCRQDLDAYRRQLAELEDEQARVRERVQSLETKLGAEEQRLDSLRAKLAGYAQALSQ
jgi:hypothetical protein